MRDPADYIAKPIRSLQTMLRVIARVDPAVTSVVPDGIYGENTVRSVRSFQSCHGLPVTGETDNGTWNQIVDAYNLCKSSVLPVMPLQIRWDPMQVIRPGERNLFLYLMQGMLMALGSVYDPIPDVEATGIFDTATQAAVRWLQERSDLPESGLIDQQVWEYLCGLYCLAAGNGTLQSGECPAS